ncbi:pyruvate kinase [Niveibacterium terrae]|uniref:pyruvate kinase n=1 Tax=Niveibacterium terrae TaxID=3373598 RepID=UPI003A8F26AA
MPTSTGCEARLIDPSHPDLSDLRSEIDALRAQLAEETAQLLGAWSGWLRQSDFLPRAQAIAIYLALSRRDLSGLQRELGRFGLALPTADWARVPGTLAAISTLLARASGQSVEPASPDELGGEACCLDAQANAVLGPALPGRSTRLIVTVPASLAGDREFAVKLLSLGVEILRLDLAQDDESVWRLQAETFRRVADELGLPLSILAELGGTRPQTVRFSEAGERRRYAQGDCFWLARAPSELPQGETGIGCSQPQIIGQLRFGDSVWIDDGELGARVVERVYGAVRLEVIQASADGKRLKSGRSLNFPDTEMAVSALSDQDLAALPFAAAHADILACSRLQGADDVAALLTALAGCPSRPARALALAIKPESRRAARNLPEILVAAASRLPCSVLLPAPALAVELGPERLGELIARIAALCAAAAVPVIRTAPELDRLVRRGPPSRRELVEAMASVCGEAVLLDRGPHLLRAVDFLADALSRKDEICPLPGPRRDALASWQAFFE